VGTVADELAVRGVAEEEANRLSETSFAARRTFAFGESPT